MAFDLIRALVGSRTPNLLIRSQVLYPIELRVQLAGAKIRFFVFKRKVADFFVPGVKVG